MPSEFTTHIAGVKFPNADRSNRTFNVRPCAPGELVELRLKPKNKHDPQAVAVYSIRGEQLGYLPAERAPWIGGRIRLGEDIRAVFQAVTEHGALIRINRVGKPPTLPPVQLTGRPRIDRSDGSQLPESSPRMCRTICRRTSRNAQTGVPTGVAR